MGSLEIMKMDIKRMFRAPKFYLLIFFTMYFLMEFTGGLKSYAQALQLGVAPYVYPLFYGDYSSRLFALMVIVLLMSDAPYVDSSQKYTYIRTGDGKWFLGKCLYILGESMLYQLIFMLLSVLILLPEVGISTEWGDVLSALANNPEEITAYFGDTSMADIVLEYSPWEAMLYTFVLSSMISVTIGLFIFLLNGVTHSALGTVLAMAACTGELFLVSVAAKGVKIPFPVIVSWMNLANVSAGENVSGKTPIGTLVMVLAAICVVMSVLIYIAIRRKIINIAED